jgi:aspartyl-tRNA synthetase
MSESSERRADLARPDSHPARTHTCGDLRGDDVGDDDVVLKGWVDTRRDLGGLVFLDVRDRYGRTQIVLRGEDAEEAYETAHRLRSEDVISVRGTVQERQDPNDDLPTGRIEVAARELVVLSTADPLPFRVSAQEETELTATEAMRLKHRYLDLRRPELQRNMRLRNEVYQTTHRHYNEHDFVEVETPVLMKSTPEGARDFLVPSRLHPGRFYALPQSPQTYKQLLMVGGLDRYVQIVKCFRDEDLRADRQPEFTQVDVEMTFATEEEVYDLTEGHMQALWQDVLDAEIETPFPRMTYDEALRRYGTDKPDTRFGMEIQDLSEALRGSGFRVFDSIIDEGGKVVGVVAEGEADRGRSAMDRLEDYVTDEIGAAGLIYFTKTDDGAEANVSESALPENYVAAACDAAGAEADDLVLVLAGDAPAVYKQAGQLRLHVAEELDLRPAQGEEPWNFLWVTNFPLLEYDDDAERHFSMHHPFTAPQPEHLDQLEEKPGAVRARAYDLVLNGNELGGGSIRIHRREIQQRVFDLLGIGEEEAEERFGFLLDAFRYGAPPHGGIALGLDRIVMLLAGADSLRDVIAFPKTQSAQEPMTGAPGPVDDEQLKALSLRTEVDDEAQPFQEEKHKAARQLSSG